ncbi:mitochondrial fission ELM1 family protein [Prosthecodimorpha staleyi]|uniref:Mitochondrial fission ELM1 family protein n=1 Tax=Prosthecodimorpha staleyi TaxID=2840188 RepID=A0A947DAZ1_9HYPH|nr:mitochondrial fission ELM1 family protein [Prosthecodimorpha staleyi]MBT9290639.1 mitochondrial fission ELM1 family protein [Prosthecodimorpha staleyi]
MTAWRPILSDPPAPTAASPPTVWILTDGKAGDVGPCLGLAEALGAHPRLHVVPRERSHLAKLADLAGWPAALPDELAPPWPDLVLACGAPAVPFARAIKRRAGRRSFVVFLRDPRPPHRGAFDMLWMPAHDGPRGRSIVVTETSPHRIAPALLARHRARPPVWAETLPGPRIAVVVGGGPGLDALPDRLERLLPEAGSFMMTPSRRTDPALAARIAAIVGRRPAFVWTGEGDNPYPAMLALADAIVVTGDSHNMVSEALATGRPVLVHEPATLKNKFRRFLDGLYSRGLIRPFEGRLESYTYEALDSTKVVADEIARRLEAFRTTGRGGA